MRNVLLVEDNRGDKRLIEEALSDCSEDVTLTHVDDGDYAIAYLEDAFRGDKKLPHLIVLDLSLPKKDGREVLRFIKADPRFKIIPVIIFTSSSLERDVRECYEFGANSYIIKHPGVDEYFQAVKSIKDFWMREARLPT